MTSPPRELNVQCPKCGQIFTDWVRDSINLSLEEEWTEEEIEEATTVTCPHCHHRQANDSLIILFDNLE